MSFLGFGFAALVVGFLAVSAAAGFLLWKVSKDLPDYESLAKYEPPVMTRIHAHDGSADRRVRARAAHLRADQHDSQARDRRLPVGRGPAASTSTAALDFQGIARAVFKVVEPKIEGRTERTEGASTITQQVAKNFLLSQRPHD